MKKYLIGLANLALLVGLVFFPTVSAQAADLRGGERVSITDGETITEDLYLGGGMINSSAAVDGDLFAAGANVTVDGQVSEDLHAAGGSVSVLGDVLGDARLVGGNITVAGSVGEDLIVLGGNVQLSGDGIAGDLVWAGGTLNLSTPVSGDIQLYGEDAYISSTVAGDVEFYGKRLVLEDGAEITGNLTYEAPTEADIQDGATVAGEVSYEQSSEPISNGKDAAFALSASALLFLLLVRATGSLVVGLGLPRFTNDVTSAAFSRPWGQLGRGFVGLIALPIASIILMVTLVGLPFGILGLLLYGALVIVAMFVAPILLGAWTHKLVTKADRPTINWMTILLGVLLFVILDFIPVLGGLIQLGFLLLALGVTLQVVWGILRDYHNDTSEGWL